MEDADQRRLTVLAVHKWIASTALAPHQYDEFIADLYARGKLNLEEVLILTEAYANRQPPESDLMPPEVHNLV